MLPISRPIIFLDLDGVLVTEWSLRREKQWLDPLTSFEPYDPACVEALNFIIAACNPRFVLHSNRRFQYSLKDLLAIWQACAVHSSDLRLLKTYSQDDGEWFDHPNDEKAYDITAWLAERSALMGGYVVIDDEAIAVDCLIRTDEEKGLNAADAATVIETLTGPKRDSASS
ncbi:MAG: hypothetical protein ACI8W8_003176 [Rhodothermales bacterium]